MEAVTRYGLVSNAHYARTRYRYWVTSKYRLLISVQSDILGLTLEIISIVLCCNGYISAKWCADTYEQFLTFCTLLLVLVYLHSGKGLS